MNKSEEYEYKIYKSCVKILESFAIIN